MSLYNSSSVPSALIVSIVNNKGGVGKTTSTGILAQLLAYLGKKILIVDMDPQCNLSMMFDCFDRESPEIIRGLSAPNTLNIADLFKYRYRTAEEMHAVIRHTKIHNIDIIPASKRHDNTVVDILLRQTGNNNIILKRALSVIRSEYDYIIIDNAPAKDVLAVNSLFASDQVYIPVRLENFSYEGLRETLDSIIFIKEEHDIDSLNFGGAFITHSETNTISYRSAAENYAETLGNKFFRTSIRKDIKISEIEKCFRPILEYCPNTNAVFDYSNLLLEMKILDEHSESILRRSISA
ncbi:MAG: AAA family ATPase [Lachnospiraceae bacterium]|nr:AAA family ATPase [Lachnospiraceae bacterium]